MLAVIDYSREGSRPCPYSILDPEYAHVWGDFTSTDYHWEMELQEIEEELAALKAGWPSMESYCDYWAEQYRDKDVPPLPENWEELDNEFWESMGPDYTTKHPPLI